MSAGDSRAFPARVGSNQWNHNVQYGLELLNVVPNRAKNALDVGCGEGWFVRELAHRVEHVVGLDPDEASISMARSLGDTDGVEYVRGDLLSYPFEPSSFDFISCIAALHHMDEAAALHQMADLLQPGGTLAVIGLARSRLPIDLPWELGGVVVTRIHKITKSYWETPAPKVWPPTHSFKEIRRISATILPGSNFRRRILWRYVLTWTKPAGR